MELDVIRETDIEVAELIEKELKRQQTTIELIASENFTSKAVMAACGSVLTNKYAEGKPHKRFYNGCENVDIIEELAQERAKKLFNAEHANVQPHSGAQANMAVFMYAVKPGDTVMGMDLSNGGHLSHGSPVNFSGLYFNIVSYGINDNGEIDYNNVREMALKHKPKLIICGASNYSKVIDFKKFKEIADEVGALLLADIAHIAALVATGEHPSPFPYADFVTTTTHKTLRGPRGGIIMCKEEHAMGIDKAVFPGMQGGPLEHIIAGKAICFTEALEPSFKEYQKQVLANIKAMEEVFNDREVNMISNGSDNHLILLDLRSKKISGKQLEEALEEIGIIVNRNAIKNDPRPKSETSGIRIGTAAITTRGATEKECKFIAHQICHMIDILTGDYDYDCVELHKDIFEQQLEKELTFKEVVLEIMKENTEHFCLEHPIYK